MARRRRPMNLNIAKVNDDHAESELEQSFMVSSDAFTAAGMKVHGSGLEVIDEDAMSRSPSSRSSRASSSSSSSSSAGTSSAGGKSGESDGGSTPTSGRRSSHVGDLNPEHIEILKELGRGASSYVQLVRNKKTNKKMALKFSGCFYREGKISVAIEYMDMGSLDQVLARHAPGGIPESVLASMTFQCLWGLAYLKHEHRLHRDIKPQNILLNSRGNIKLTDFGISRELENSIGKCMTIVGTFKYMSPERILAEKYSYSSDVWSMGLVLIELATSKYPYSGIHSMIEMAQTVTESDPPVLEGDQFTGEFRDLIALCLRKEARRRPAADQLLGDPWLKIHSANTMALATRSCKAWVEQVLTERKDDETRRSAFQKITKK